MAMESKIFKETLLAEPLKARANASMSAFGNKFIFVIGGETHSNPSEYLLCTAQ